jgi:hypothetical protein
MRFNARAQLLLWHDLSEHGSACARLCGMFDLMDDAIGSQFRTMVCQIAGVAGAFEDVLTGDAVIGGVCMSEVIWNRWITPNKSTTSTAETTRRHRRRPRPPSRARRTLPRRTQSRAGQGDDNCDDDYDNALANLTNSPARDHVHTATTEITQLQTAIAVELCGLALDAFTGDDFNKKDGGVTRWAANMWRARSNRARDRDRYRLLQRMDFYER